MFIERFCTAYLPPIWGWATLSGCAAATTSHRSRLRLALAPTCHRGITGLSRFDHLHFMQALYGPSHGPNPKVVGVRPHRGRCLPGGARPLRRRPRRGRIACVGIGGPGPGQLARRRCPHRANHPRRQLPPTHLHGHRHVDSELGAAEQPRRHHPPRSGHFRRVPERRWPTGSGQPKRQRRQHRGRVDTGWPDRRPVGRCGQNGRGDCRPMEPYGHRHGERGRQFLAVRDHAGPGRQCAALHLQRAVAPRWRHRRHLRPQRAPVHRARPLRARRERCRHRNRHFLPSTR